MLAFTAHDQPLQECLAAFRNAAGFQERPILFELLLVRQILIPGDIGREPISEEHGQLLGRHEPLAAFDAPRHGIFCPRAMETISVCSRIDRVPQNRQGPGGRRCPPLQLPDAPATMAAESQSQVIDDQVAEDRVGGTEFVELLEDQPDHPTRLFVRLLNDLARGRLEVSQGDGQEQLAALGLVTTAAEQAIAHRDQFIFAHRAFHTKEEAIVAVQGIVDTVLIAQDSIENGTHVNELMPILVGSREPAELDAQHDPDVVQADFGHQPLEARPTDSRPGAAGLILVDDHHTLGRPAEPLCELRQGILPFAGFAVLDHLLRRRLPHIHHREPIEMPIENLRRRPQPEGRGRRSHSRRSIPTVGDACVTSVHRAPPGRWGVRRVVEARCR